MNDIAALLRAAERSLQRNRNRVLILLMFGTSPRASEVCSLRLSDLDLNNRSCTVIGKGNKRRQVFFGRDTARALWAYLGERFDSREQASMAQEPVFLADRGALAGDPMTRSGLLQLFGRLGKAARLQGVRCSPHTMRYIDLSHPVHSSIRPFSCPIFPLRFGNPAVNAPSKLIEQERVRHHHYVRNPAFMLEEAVFDGSELKESASRPLCSFICLVKARVEV